MDTQGLYALKNKLFEASFKTKLSPYCAFPSQSHQRWGICTQQHLECPIASLCPSAQLSFVITVARQFSSDLHLLYPQLLSALLGSMFRVQGCQHGLGSTADGT